MPAAKPGDIWIVDLGMAAKVRPCLILTAQPRGEDLDIFTIVAPTTAVRGSYWEISVKRPYLDDDAAFDVQRIATVASAKLERKLGELTQVEMNSILDRLAERLGL